MPFLLMRSMFCTLLTRYLVLSAYPAAALMPASGDDRSGPA